jgi:hypothetical protein
MMRMMVVAALITASAAAQELSCDMSGYKAQDGLKAEVRAGTLELSWQGELREQLRAGFAIRGGQPVVQELAARKKGGNWVVLGKNRTPEYELTTGARSLLGEEPDANFGGHYVLVFPKPLFFSHVKEPAKGPAGQPFEENLAPYGKAYHTTAASTELNLLNRNTGWFGRLIPERRVRRAIRTQFAKGTSSGAIAFWTVRSSRCPCTCRGRGYAKRAEVSG